MAVARGIVFATGNSPESRSYKLGAKANSSQSPSTYADRLLQYIPGEALAVFLAVNGYFLTAGTGEPVFEWIAFVLVLVGGAGYAFAKQRALQATARALLLFTVVSTIALAVWIFSIGGPFKQLTWYHQEQSAVIVPLFVFLAPLFAK